MVRGWLAFQLSIAKNSHILPRKIVKARCPNSEYESKSPSAALAAALPVVGCPERVSVKENCPFWLLVQVGQADTLISSLSFSPDFSYNPPNFNVWLPFTHVKLSEIS